MTSHRPELHGRFGMAASTHWLGTATAMSVLERGGNAFDAAIACGFVLQIAEPHLCGPLGEMPAVVWSARDDSASVVCGQGIAPARATTDRFRSELGLDLVPGTGLLAATVPGAFGGWMLMLERWGTWRVRDVLEYVIGYARRGVPAAPLLSAAINGVTDLFVRDWPTSAAIWLDGERPPNPFETVRQPRLAETYERLVREAERAGSDRDQQIRRAVDAWYRGFVAETIVEFCDARPWRDSSGREHGGLLSGDDLAGWSATIEPPVTHDFGGYTVCKTGSWGQGPVFLQQLALLDALGIDDVDYGSADFLHLSIEAAKLAFADREAWYGDSNQIPDLVGHLLDRRYNLDRSRLVGDTASFELRPGSIAGRQPVVHSPTEGSERSTIGAGEPTLGSDGTVSGDTCHVDVVDRWGNMVSATPSGGWLQSSPAIPELGFCLGTRAQMFVLADGHPNSLRPGARPRTTLTPTLALRDGQQWMAFGTPGGDQQDQWSVAFFLAVVLGGLDLQAAIDAPAFTSYHFPSSFYPRDDRPGHLAMESRFDTRVIDALRQRGHIIDTVGPWALGRLSAVARDPEGNLRGAANSRGALGYAAGR